MIFSKPPFEVADVFRKFGNAYQNRCTPSDDQLKVMAAIEACRTAILGGHRLSCSECGHTSIAYNSCRNRHCPKCQFLPKEQWVENRKADLLPISYFHVVFTLPGQLNRLCLYKPRLLYNLLFKAAWQTIRTLAEDKKWIGAQPGMTAVLHTWGQNLTLHPHLHCIVTGGGLDCSNNWIHAKSNGNFLFPVKVLSKLFRGKFLALLKSNLSNPHPFRSLFDSLYKSDWVVYAKKPFAGPEQVLQYLGKYSHRIAIANHRIVQIADSTVTFRWKDYRDDTTKLMILNGVEFTRRFLLHVLPHNFQKIRHFGVLANCKRKISIQQASSSLDYIVSNPVTLNPVQVIFQRFGVLISLCPVCKKGEMTISQIIPNTRGSPLSNPV